MAGVYTITEPHPTVPKNSYVHSGRGGAGNYFRAPKTTPAEGVAKTISNTSTSSKSGTTRFHSGRGGAGNAHEAAARIPLNFDEEFARAEARDKAAHLGHVGRGGAGNVFVSEDGYGDGESLRRRPSGSSDGSARSSLSGIWNKVRNSIVH
ncbi:hypothetical protein VTJ04DRAFT_8123 [Mycothermus thermophilus]|uniref:uncharacterized protein n=1 Tax=Humicola insolens TaxID=85995 RepID=UPI003743960D